MMRLLNRLRLREFPVLLVRLVVTAGGAPIQQGHLDRGQVHHVVVEVGTFSQLGEPRPGLGVPGHVLDADAGRRHSRVLGTKVLHAVRHRADASADALQRQLTPARRHVRQRRVAALTQSSRSDEGLGPRLRRRIAAAVYIQSGDRDGHILTAHHKHADGDRRATADTRVAHARTRSRQPSKPTTATARPPSQATRAT
uniref:Putative secreted protein n=1 Tax=Ixodes ricinus TaxID=34613 RepID=A0A6B0V0Q3_IXORI